MVTGDGADTTSADAFDLLAQMTARLASTARLDEIVDAVLGELVELGFGAVWMASIDEETQHLVTLKEVIDGVDTTHEMPPIFMLDMRQPIGHGFRERRMINVVDPDSLHIIDRDDDAVPPNAMALPRIIYQHLRGHPFACGPLLGSRGQPVGALGLSSYRGREPIPDEVFSRGLLRAFMDHLGIAMERALDRARLESVHAELVKAHHAIAHGARSQAVGELAAAVAHDLNNLCGVALMAVSMGMRSPASALDALPRIERANRAIGDLIARLQRVARSASEEGTAHTCCVEQIIDDIAVMLSPILREQSIALVLELAPAPRVRCDPVLVHQLVLNLVLNACDALSEVPAEHRELRIQIRKDGDSVCLTVGDRGPGIAPDVMPQLFQPFVTTKGNGHVGLGLAAAHASLKHLGGQIVGRNSASGGAEFVVSLPAASEDDQSVAAAPGRAQVRAQHRGSVLAIDDDPDLIDVVREYLESVGYAVVVAADGARALELAKSSPFDLILCDVGLPSRSGLDVCQTLRASGYRGKLVLMTGWDSRTVRQDQRATACDSVLQKPFLGVDLLNMVDALFPS